MRRFTVMGFTEAELGFILAALFAAIAAATLHERDARAGDAKQYDDAAKYYQEKYDSAASAFGNYRDSTRAEMHRLQDSLSALTKRSTKVPQCWEKGEQRGPIAEVVVLGRNQYQLHGETLDLDGIRERLAAYIARGELLGCRYVLRARLTSGVDAIDQADAVWRLRRYFDVNDRPQ